jgi:lipopolysaccharide/colanic/teichoic acid biosynthesis glycosyltransferase
MLKRTFDILCSLTALVVLSPLFAIAIPLLTLTGEGEVFYRQERVGRAGRTFSILKFATMLKNSPNLAGGDITTHNDPRVLPFGRILRKTKINELPQLINILRGDMSIIGPRPLTPRIYRNLPESYRAAIMETRPGLSGIGSVVFCNEESLLREAHDRDKIYFGIIVPYKAELERWYAQNRSFAVDLRLIGLTLMAMLGPRNFDLAKFFPGIPPMPPSLLALRAQAVGRSADLSENIISR